ncbi:MAG: carboxylating nicotinate-nucleotide diphosphorylase [Deltaproteobacteria bacterium]|nr:carboxylating nicotinate-nucleotide diphosphorylase [Deltaproteobacteria bacterium]
MPDNFHDPFRTPEIHAGGLIARLVELALDEDIGPGDLTTEATMGPCDTGKAVILAGEPLVVAGLFVAERVFSVLDEKVGFRHVAKDGDYVQKGEVLAEISGRMRPLLTGERTALNFLQRLSGVATHVRKFMADVPPGSLKVLDTRKTTPGFRVLEKYAVRVGGGSNHRMGLYDGVLIKDNHVTACGGVAEAVRRVRRVSPHTIKIEVEADTLEQVAEALEAGADAILLDNMDDATIGQAVAINKGRALLEVSGGITASRLAALSTLGVDMASAGALTHAAISVDIKMDIL